MEVLRGDLTRLVSCSSPIVLCACSWGIAAALAAPHFMYAFIWFKPHIWQRWFGDKSVDAFATCGALGKLLQFTFVVLWVACSRSRGLCLDLGIIRLPQWLLALALFGYGQSLNAGIFKAIGHVGVYYGFKLGHQVPWVTGWPFDTVQHPQYVGSVMSIAALAVLLWGQVPTGGLVVLAVFWTALYLATAAHEQYTH